MCKRLFDLRELAQALAEVSNLRSRKTFRPAQIVIVDLGEVATDGRLRHPLVKVLDAGSLGVLVPPPGRDQAGWNLRDVLQVSNIMFGWGGFTSGPWTFTATAVSTNGLESDNATTAGGTNVWAVLRPGKAHTFKVTVP